MDPWSDKVDGDNVEINNYNFDHQIRRGVGRYSDLDENFDADDFDAIPLGGTTTSSLQGGVPRSTEEFRRSVSSQTSSHDTPELEEFDKPRVTCRFSDELWYSDDIEFTSERQYRKHFKHVSRLLKADSRITD
jgi:hypothetical protein